jgi:hypothetical protein
MAFADSRATPAGGRRYAMRRSDCNRDAVDKHVPFYLLT